MKFEKNSWDYWEVDCFNNEKYKEKILQTLKPGDYTGIYFKNGDKWVSRSSGMSFDMTGMKLYKELKEFLDKEFNKFMLNRKLKKVISK